MKRMKKIEDYKEAFKKITRVDKQQKDWDKLEKSGGIIPSWYKYKQSSEKKRKRRNPRNS